MLLKPFVFLLAIAPCSALPHRRVVNGKDAMDNDPRPWNVWLRKGKERLHCGGTLISDSWVLTAASCLNNQINAVVAGCDDRTFPRGTEQFSEVAEAIMHPDFNETTLENDIGLIRVATPFLLNRKVQPLPFLTEGILDGVDLDQIYEKQCRISGWGQPTFMRRVEFANPLKELVIDRVSDSVCDRRFEDRPSSVMCFEPYRRPGLSSTCDGDQGGPFICKVRLAWYLVGVISSWKTDVNCTNGIKGATGVIGYEDWIISTVGTAVTVPIAIIDPTEIPESTPEVKPILPKLPDVPIEEPIPSETPTATEEPVPEAVPSEAPIATEESVPEPAPSEEPTAIEEPASEPTHEEPTATEGPASEPIPSEEPTAIEEPASEPNPEEPTATEKPASEPNPEEPTAIEEPAPEPTPEESTAIVDMASEPTPEEPTATEEPASEPSPVESTAIVDMASEPTPEEPTATEEPASEPSPVESTDIVDMASEPTPSEEQTPEQTSEPASELPTFEQPTFFEFPSIFEEPIGE